MKNEELISDENYNKVQAHKGPAFVEFFATWCPHCQRMAPIISELAAEYDGKIKFFLVDVDKAPEACDKNNISGTPTMLLRKDGKKQGEIVGERPKEELKEALDALL
ncbi:MAG: thioredoxin family protein [Elusimicrobiota bacterium]|jgi:thioredoxin 1|nr:thioredoxin family protein [Elusimicrobiota bacterium]